MFKHARSMRDAKGYADISDYGFLSDCRSAALVAADGSVDWLCWPRFDSVSLFGAILDSDLGGSWTMRPVGDWTSSRRYVESTNVLETTFRTQTGEVTVCDWLHVGARTALCRLVTGVRGVVELETRCDPRPDYGVHGPVEWTDRLGYLTAPVPSRLQRVADGELLVLDGFSEDNSSRIRFDDGVPCRRFTIVEGRCVGFTLGWDRPGPSDVPFALERALSFWHGWSSELRLPRRYADEVVRSSLALKGLQYEPTGAILAAATTSLPEDVGGERNYDYRFSWLRDATFTLYALRAVGKYSEAQSYLDWLQALGFRAGDRSLAIMYGIESDSVLVEQELVHLEGYRQSRPVRTGNGAHDQRQLDTYGELLDAIWLQRVKRKQPLNRHRALLVMDLAQRALDEWQIPDEGIWEVRGEPQHFVYSKVMCWVALDRAVRLARFDPDQFADAPVSEWREVREKIREQVLTEGYDEQLGAFTQSYGSRSLDASNLLMAQVGFIPAQDPRFVRTVRAVQRDLTRNGLVDRYRVQNTDDGFSGEEGTFTICTLWLVLALVQIGAKSEARDLFEKVLSMGNDVGLFSEELSPEGMALGNFPQAFTHIAIVACAFALER
jgi:GH15 family glucan-1,4-alpha-glucosidase